MRRDSQNKRKNMIVSNETPDQKDLILQQLNKLYNDPLRIRIKYQGQYEEKDDEYTYSSYESVDRDFETGEVIESETIDYSSTEFSEDESKNTSDKDFIVDDSDTQDGDFDIRDSKEKDKYDFESADMMILYRDILKEIKKTGMNCDEPVKQSVYQTVTKLEKKYKDLFLVLFEPKMDREHWKIGKNKEEISQVEPLLIKIYDELEKEYELISESGIIGSQLPYKLKKEMLEQLHVLKNMPNFNPEYFELRRSMINTIQSYNRQKIEKANQLEEIDKFEHELKTMCEANPYLFKIHELKNNFDEMTLSILYKKYKESENHELDSDTRSLSKIWLDNVLSLPFNKNHQVKTDSIRNIIVDMKKIMDNKIYGLDIVKEQILCIMNNRLRNPSKHNIPIAMEGPPGTGKTVLAKCIADALGLPFEHISLAGVSDGCTLKGKEPVWVGAQPGRIVKILQRMNCSNGIVFIDEVDKVRNTSHGKEVQSVLLDILEYPQNTHFVDSFIGNDIHIDLSNIIWIVAMNDSTELEKSLISRLNIVKIPEYKTNDKMKICNDYIIPSILEEIQLPKDKIEFEASALRYLIEHCKDEGVRIIRNKLKQLFNKISLVYSTQIENEEMEFSFGKTKDFKFPLTIDTSIMTKFIKINDEVEHWKQYSMYR